MSTSSLRIPIAVTFRRTPLANRWVSERWEPVAVEIEYAAGSATPIRTREDAGQTWWRFGAQSLELHRSEAEGYFLNLTAPEPKVFVMWRPDDAEAVPPVVPAVVTVSYHEAARMLDGGEQVDAVPLPVEIREWMVPFVAEHYKPEPRRKVRRNDPFRDDAEARRRERSR
jgi:hypothetical protein